MRSPARLQIITIIQASKPRLHQKHRNRNLNCYNRKTKYKHMLSVAKQKQIIVPNTSATERISSITSVVSIVSIKDGHLVCSSLKRMVGLVLQMRRRRHLVLHMTDPRVVKARHLQMVEGPRPAGETRLSTKVKIVRGTECAGLRRSCPAVCHGHRPHAGRPKARPK